MGARDFQAIWEWLFGLVSVVGMVGMLVFIILIFLWGAQLLLECIREDCAERRRKGR